MGSIAVVANKCNAGLTHLILRLAEEALMVEFTRPRVVGFNHIALEVADIDEALAFYGRLFRFELRGKNDTSWPSSTWAISLSPFRRAAGSPQTMVAISVSSLMTRRRPAKHWRPLVLLYLMVRSLFRLLGQQNEVHDYDNIQYAKDRDCSCIGLTHLAKNEKAKKELAAKGMALE